MNHSADPSIWLIIAFGLMTLVLSVFAAIEIVELIKRREKKKKQNGW